MHLIEQLQCRTENTYKPFEYTALHLGMHDECIANLEYGKFAIYWDVYLDGQITSIHNPTNMEHVDILKDKELVKLIRETEKNGQELGGIYNWVQKPMISPVFCNNEGNYSSSSQHWRPDYLRSAFWCKIQSIKMMKDAFATLPLYQKDRLTEDDLRFIEALKCIHGVSILLNDEVMSNDSNKEAFKEELARKVFLKDGIFDSLKYIDCEISDGVCNVIWEATTESTSNKVEEWILSDYKRAGDTF